MKKLSVVLIAICTFLFIGCSSSNKKSDLKEKDVNTKTVYNNPNSQSNISNDNEKTDEKVKEKSEDNKDKKRTTANIDNSVKGNTTNKNGNKKSKTSKVQKNNVNQIIINEMNLEKNSPFKMGMSIRSEERRV